MNKAYIVFNSITDARYSGEGSYVLIFNGEVIGKHFCSNRAFANHDLTVWRIEELDKYEIDEVYSNDELVWKRNDEETNKQTQGRFEVANDIYEALNCY